MTSDAPTTEQPQLLATSVGDQCANCGARLAGDQRYCVECGERRGKPRYSLPVPATSAGRAPAYAGRQRPPWSGSSTLIGGIAVLLIAMGVGVLIGRTSNGATVRAPTYKVIGVPGASAGAPTAGTATTPTTATSTPGTSSKSKSSKSTASAKATSKNPAAALAAKLPPAAKTIPKKLQSKVAKVGQKCTSGPGCTGGKFTGTFFGGGG